MRISTVILSIIILLSGCSLPDKSQEIEETRFLLDTVCTIIAGGDNSGSAINAAFEAIREIQAAVDFYDENSVVSRFNRAEKGEIVFLDTHSAAIIDCALKISQASNGAFDITIAPVQQLWNFKAETPALPREDEINSALLCVGYEHLNFNPDKKTLSKTMDGVEIDLGGAAKGYAADVAVQVLKDAGIEYAIINLGGNVAVFGENPHNPKGGWNVGIQKPFAPDGQYSNMISVDQGAVVTSGTYQRHFIYEGKNYHHILDPSTGYPAEQKANSITIAADSALVADCLSTACMVLGGEDSRQLADRYNAKLYIIE